MIGWRAPGSYGADSPSVAYHLSATGCNPPRVRPTHEMIDDQVRESPCYLHDPNPENFLDMLHLACCLILTRGL